jgi:hypothetical protein
MAVDEDDGTGARRPLTARKHLQALYDRVNLITARAVDKDEVAQLVNVAIQGLQAQGNVPWLSKAEHNGVQDGNRQAIQDITGQVTARQQAITEAATQAATLAQDARARADTAHTRADAAHTRADAAHIRADAAHTLATSTTDAAGIQEEVITTLQDTVQNQGGLLNTHQTNHATHAATAARYLSEMGTIKRQQEEQHLGHTGVLEDHIEQLTGLTLSVRNITATQAEQARQLQGQQTPQQLQETLNISNNALKVELQQLITANNDTLKQQLKDEILAMPIEIRGGGKKQRKSSYRRRRSRKR